MIMISTLRYRHTTRKVHNKTKKIRRNEGEREYKRECPVTLN